MRWRSGLLLVAAAVVVSAPASAQDATRTELFAGGGASRMGGDDGSLGSGGSLTAGLSVSLARGWRGEADVLWTEHARRVGGYPLEGRATGAIGSVVHRFGSGGVQPFVMVSLGALRFTTTRAFIGPSGEVGSIDLADTQRAWGGGGGARVRLTTRLLLRPQFRLLFTEQTGVLGLATGSVAVGYTW